MECLGKIIALVISFLTVQKIWLSNQKTKLENEILRLQLRKSRRGG